MIGDRREIAELRIPSKSAGLLGKLEDFTRIFLKNLPEGVQVQHPDIQSPFDNAYSIRGNDLFLEMLDDPGAVDTLLSTVTDSMIVIVPHLKSMISSDREWFFDMGALWKGTARISNCSTTMIDPRMYDRFVLPQDSRLYDPWKLAETVPANVALMQTVEMDSAIGPGLRQAHQEKPRTGRSDGRSLSCFTPQTTKSGT